MKKAFFSILMTLVAMTATAVEKTSAVGTMTAVENPTLVTDTIAVKIVGTVLDSLSNEGEPYATVRLYKGDRTTNAVAMTVTDMDGKFSLDAKGYGNYTLWISSVGRTDIVRVFEMMSSANDLGTMFISDNATMLDAVTIVAQKPLVKMETDKMTYNVQEDTDSRTNTVLDMLRKVPMVSVDGQDNITVKGSSAFQVYVNGKPSVMFSSNPSQVLKGMPASSVKNIEVITSPGAKYDVEGVGGILNLVMADAQKTETDAYTGTVKATAGTQVLGGSAFVSGQKGKLTYSANASYNLGKSDGVETLSRTEQETAQGTSVVESRVKTDGSAPFTMGSLSLGYDFNELSSLSTTLSVSKFGIDQEYSPQTRLFGGIYGDGFDYSSASKMKMDRTSVNWNVDFQRFLNKEKTSSFTVAYQLSSNPQTSEESNRFNAPEGVAMDLTDRSSRNEEKTMQHILQADLSTQISAGHTLNFGAKAMLRNSSVDASLLFGGVEKPEMGTDYSYDNAIAAVYGEYRGKLGKASLTTGLRYEHTWLSTEYRGGKGEDFSSNYGNLVPSLTLSYALSPQNNIGANYTMRISRPGITYLNPYIDRSDPTALSYGNPDIDVEKSHNTELVFNHFSRKFMLNATLSHSFCNNQISEYSFYRDYILNTTYGNVARNNRTGLSLYANWLLAPKTRLFLNGGASYVDLRSDALDLRNSGWQANLMAGIQQTLPKEISLSAYLITSTKNITLQGNSSSFNLLTASASKSFLDKRLNVGISALLGLSDGGNLRMKSTSHTPDFRTTTDIKIPMRNISLALSYTFGNSAYKAKDKKKHAETDFIDRQSSGEQIMKARQF